MSERRDALTAAEPETVSAAVDEMANDEIDSYAEELRQVVGRSDLAKSTRMAAARRLGSGQSNGARTLLTILAEDEPPAREIAVAAMTVCRDEATLVSLIDALADDVNTVRNAAERTLLDRIDDVVKHGIPRLLESLKHEVALTRSPAARVLGQTEDERALPPLLAMLREDETWLGRMWAAQALGELGQTGAFNDLADSLSNDEKNRVRAAAATAIAKLRHAESRAQLESAADDPDNGVKKAVEEGLELLQLSDSSGRGDEDDSSE